MNNVIHKILAATGHCILTPLCIFNMVFLFGFAYLYPDIYGPVFRCPECALFWSVVAFIGSLWWTRRMYLYWAVPSSRKAIEVVWEKRYPVDRGVWPS